MLKIKMPLLIIAIIFTLVSNAQKRVMTYPFEFEKAFLAKGEYDAYFLGNTADAGFALVLRDNKKAEYILLDKKFKTASKISSALTTTVFDGPVLEYVGGTTGGGKFHFVYSGKDHFIETVDFNNKSTTHKKLFEDTKAEQPLISFSSNNVFYALTTNKKTSQLVFYVVDAEGKLTTKSIDFPIPPDAGKWNDDLPGYLKKVKVIKFDEQPDLSSVVGEAKLFTYPDRMEFMVNIAGHATHIVTLSLPDMKLTEKFIEYADIVPASEKKKWYINSFQKDGKVFSLLLNKKEIRIAIHDQASHKLLNQYLLTNDRGAELLAQQPVREIRFGKKTNEKEMDIKKLIKEFTKGTEGLMVSKNKAGQLILTVGTYDLTPLSSGGSSGGYSGGWQNASASPGSAASRPVWNPTMYYRPGTPAYTTTSARYYTSAFCKLLLDPATLKVSRGKIPTPEPDQIKDYIDGVSSKAKATNQFSLGTEQFYGYYDKDEKAYVVDLIRIIQ